tara:strand:- start:103 stop:894 length:792 start_codon:yes stop_codon:yes gene_type:complete
MSTSTKARGKRRRVASPIRAVDGEEGDIEAEYAGSGLPQVRESYSAPVATTTQSYNYKQMDELIEQYSAHHNKSKTATAEIVCCPRAYEEAFLREPIGSERQCANNAQCQGLRIIGASGFVLREFTLPDQPDPLPNDPRSLCLMCRRYEIARLFFLHESRREPLSENVIVSPYYNMVGVDGEYNVHDAIVSEGKYTGLPLPVVLHSRSAYKQCTVNGVKGFKQTGMQDALSSTGSSFLARRAVLHKHTLQHSTAHSAHLSTLG